MSMCLNKTNNQANKQTNKKQPTVLKCAFPDETDMLAIWNSA